MAEVKHRTASQIVDGLQVPAKFCTENVRFAMRFEPLPGDVVLLTYPKCGTTWAQQMLLLIFSKGVPSTSAKESFAASPFLEFLGADGAKAMKRPGVLKTHLAFHLTPFSSEAKYIYVSRNPKDCCVSYFYHSVRHQYQGSFDEFFELFISGEVDFGDYFDHLLEWYKRKDYPNVLFATYEEMKTDPKAAALKFATFLGKEYVQLLNNNPKVLEDVLHYSSFDYMQKKFNEDLNQLLSMDEKSLLNDRDISESMKNILMKKKADKKQDHERKTVPNFIRKGIVGDWRNHFSQEQSRRINEKFSQKLKGTEFFDLWKDYL